VKMLALSFLILVGFTLILESFDVHVPKGYIYFAMFFSIAVESQERASVDARRDVALEVYQVAAILFVARTEEMVETDIIDRGGR
ncbi:hypothetical protein MJI12_26005, partial [Salmonella enterica subsp. enterica serovar Kentucky]|nr:hypothetical protein [Salmonella enterica subsp. enterica serovar Kentucky]